ncbi:four helix bundle protein [Microbulbifer celer]|uniref:Four helix bundle protein n=1 Tax=Microbulbifer celer TaxID=435905 RepID=A0ABW3U758_9GAMM|nr:four helix bundle protein [Microbulbifer celer]UFN58545.1 four helix bundle protein [Microbulbifer celer]
MKPYQLPEIVKKSERLLVDIEQAVRGFARYHKYTLGTDMRRQAMAVLRMCHRAWRDRSRQLYWVNELVWAIDELKLSLQLGSQLHAFKSFKQFESLIRAAEEVGRCAGGWKRQLHRKGQNSGSNASPERAQILSGRAASAGYVGANQ